MKVLTQGAESIIYLDNDKIIKDRIKKDYRIEELDNSLRKFRTKREVKILGKVNVNVPKVLKVDETKFSMEFIEGDLLRDYLNEENYKEIMREIGVMIRKLHDQDIIHGDLTTSNMILKDNKIYFIDFGLGVFSNKVEDKAVDIHLFKQAINSKHYRIAEEAFKEVLKSYNPDKEFINRFEKVESRGRYKKKKL